MFDLHFLVFLAPLGLYYCFQNLTDSNIFLITFSLTAIYFSGAAPGGPGAIHEEQLTSMGAVQKRQLTIILRAGKTLASSWSMAGRAERRVHSAFTRCQGLHGTCQEPVKGGA